MFERRGRLTQADDGSVLKRCGAEYSGAPPFYFTPWLWAICFLAFGGLLLFGRRSRRGNIDGLKQVQDLHRDAAFLKKSGNTGASARTC
jgi:hypothetical protein